MRKSKYVKVLAVGAVMAGLMAPSASTAYPTVAGAAEGSQYEHTSRTYPATGTFRCGDLVLRVTKGTETEVQDGYLNNGITRVAIARTWRGVVLAGSDGRRYRASGGTSPGSCSRRRTTRTRCPGWRSSRSSSAADPTAAPAGCAR